MKSSYHAGSVRKNQLRLCVVQYTKRLALTLTLSGKKSAAPLCIIQYTKRPPPAFAAAAQVMHSRKHLVAYCEHTSRAKVKHLRSARRATSRHNPALDEVDEDFYNDSSLLRFVNCRL